jgi:hypothetical protein
MDYVKARGWRYQQSIILHVEKWEEDNPVVEIRVRVRFRGPDAARGVPNLDRKTACSTEKYIGFGLALAEDICSQILENIWRLSKCSGKGQFLVYRKYSNLNLYH